MIDADWRLDRLEAIPAVQVAPTGARLGAEVKGVDPPGIPARSPIGDPGMPWLTLACMWWQERA